MKGWEYQFFPKGLHFYDYVNFVDMARMSQCGWGIFFYCPRYILRNASGVQASYLRNVWQKKEKLENPVAIAISEMLCSPVRIILFASASRRWMMYCVMVIFVTVLKELHA